MIRTTITIISVLLLLFTLTMIALEKCESLAASGAFVKPTITKSKCKGGCDCDPCECEGCRCRGCDCDNRKRITDYASHCGRCRTARLATRWWLTVP